MHRPVTIEYFPTPQAAKERCAALRFAGIHAWTFAVGAYRNYEEKRATQRAVAYCN